MQTEGELETFHEQIGEIEILGGRNARSLQAAVPRQASNAILRPSPPPLDMNSILGAVSGNY